MAAKKTAKTEGGATTISLPALNIQGMRITIVGDSPLVMHKWSEKAKQQMRDKQGKRAQLAKAAKVPHEECEAATYRTEDGELAFPAIAFKKAAVTACSHVEGITKVLARGAFHVMGELVEIEGEAKMREDMVRIAMGTADLRYRPEVFPWRCTLDIRYNANVISAEQVANLLNTAGFAVGIGEGRPERDLMWGLFHIE